MEERAPWWWKLAGLANIAAGVALFGVPGWLHLPGAGVRVIFTVAAAVFVAIGIAFLKSRPAPSTWRCPSCGREGKRDKATYYCPGCGHALETGDEELDPSEVNCPFCSEPVLKGATVCPSCSKSLPGFGVEVVKGRPSCRWCRASVEPGQKFCKSCSAPLAASR